MAVIDGIRESNIPLENLGGAKKKEVSAPIKSRDFAAILGDVQKKGRLQFSSHAQRRMMNREIVLNKEDLHKMEQAVNRLQKKGGSESLLLHRDVAYLISVKNRTVITAVDEERLQEHIFTNIDSAVILKDE